VDRSFQGLLLSLCLHALLVWLYLHAKPWSPARTDQPTEITIVESDHGKKSKKSFVTETENQEKAFDKLKDQADYLSRFTKRVEKQMRARNNDRTQNRDLNLNPTTQPITPQKQGVAGMERPQEEGGSLPSPGLKQPNMRNVAIGPSTLAEYIPGVEEGAFTALNTDQFTYYAFFSRINEQIRNRWVGNVRAYVGRLGQQELTALSKYDRQTVIEIVLTRDGRYSNSMIHQSSGDRNLDQTTLEAFRAAAPFLNPPSGLVETDNLIHLKYGFMVRFRPPNFGPAM
jgi:TonB family protein